MKFKEFKCSYGPIYDKTNLYPYRGARRLQVLLSLGHQDGLVAGEHRAVTVCGWMSLPSHDPGCFHGYGHSFSAVQAVSGVIKDPAWGQPQAEAIIPHPAVRVPPLMVGVLG